jgi:hypothetical protein
MKKYEPELGQMCFGQPWKEYEVSEILIAALRAIEYKLDIVMWNINQEEYNSPFGNTGNRFKCKVFEVQSYNWNDDEIQGYNFKYKDIEISWYKYLGRGTTVNKAITNDEISKMLDDCLSAVKKYEKTERKQKVKEGKYPF